MDDKPQNSIPDPQAETNPHVDAVLKKAHEELRLLLQQRVSVTRRIMSVKQTIAGLIKLCGEGAVHNDFEPSRRNVRRRS